MSSQTILVVDDEPDIRRRFRLWLAEEYAVRTVPDGNTAIEHNQSAVDVAILDRNLPEMHGDELARALDDGDYDGPIAMITAREPDPAISTLPLDDYLRKPVDKDSLQNLVERLLARHNARPAVRTLLAMATRKYRLENALAPRALEESPEYGTLCDRLRQTYDETIDEDSPAEYLDAHALRSLPESVDFEDVVEFRYETALRASVSVAAGQEL